MMSRDLTSKLCTRSGGFVGLVLFFLYGLKVAFVYGGMVGVIAAASIHGAPVGPELSTRIVTGAGMVLGVVVVGAIMTVLGAIFGATLDASVVAPLVRRSAKKAPKAEVEPEVEDAA